MKSLFVSLFSVFVAAATLVAASEVKVNSYSFDGTTLKGTITVQNIAYAKIVTVIYADASSNWNNNGNKCAAAWSNGPDATGYENWTFSCKIGSAGISQFYVEYDVNGSTYIDSNGGYGVNYQVKNPSTGTTAPPSTSSSRLVFAHNVVGVTAPLSQDQWVSDMKLAKSYYIDGFVLNIASGDDNNDAILTKAFNAADSVGFKLFFSFDYASRGAWNLDQVANYITNYSKRSSYYKINGRPYVSTFEGPGNAGDWVTIRQRTNCFFVPDWSSLGVDGFKSHLNDVDGAFSWDLWPNGPTDLSTSGDNAWINMLGSKQYLMGVSPWFYTSLPQWNKNWLWRGDNLWHYRWENIIAMKPPIVEIVSWNDFGESHYIGPLCTACFPQGANYCNDMPHQSWLATLPNYIARYKGIAVPAMDDKIVFWYKTNYGQSCGTGGTTGNNPNYQTTYAPYVVQEDKIFVTVLLKSPATITVQIGNAGISSDRTYTATNAGLVHFAVPKGGATGTVTVRVMRGTSQDKIATGAALTNDCPLGHVNWNAWVGESA